METYKKDNEVEVISWLKKFAKMVRDNNYEKAESLFDSSTFGFGTIAQSYTNLAEYRSLQWQDCWVGTREFDFDYATLKMVGINDLVIAGVFWTSIGVRPNTEEFPREGRATIVFKRDSKTGALVSIHNHYSRTPKNFPEHF